MRNTNIVNDTNQSLSVYAVVLRVWNDTTFEQELEWPKGKTVKQVLDSYQQCCLGDKKVYKVIDFYARKD